MKKIVSILLTGTILLTGCSINTENTTDITQPATENTVISSDSYMPLNYSVQKATWLPYLEFPEYISGKTEPEFIEAVRNMLSELSAEGINTVYFHAHPEGDAYYKSDIFPKGIYLDGDYDPFEIFLDIAHSMDVSVHAWINPYRLQKQEDMEKLPDSFIVKQWINSGSPMVRLVNGRYYLNPAYSAVTELISNTAKEIVENYSVDGIHIDDYFYPTADDSFDAEAFEASGCSDRDSWRRENITAMVKSLYDTVKKNDDRLKFGISPQGNISSDYNTQYADVELWTKNEGYADYIVPQIYYGFNNAVCPFEATLRQWEELAQNGNISLVIGLAAYKNGKYDKWAGVAGENEWIDNPDIIPRQIELVNLSDTADGYALYQ